MAAAQVKVYQASLSEVKAEENGNYSNLIQGKGQDVMIPKLDYVSFNYQTTGQHIILSAILSRTKSGVWWVWAREILPGIRKRRVHNV